jgi:hypothetical protein
VQVPRCSWQSKALDKAPYKLSGAVAKLAGITFLSLAFSYWIDNLGFITEGKLAAIFIKPSLRVCNWPVIYFINYTPTSSLALVNTAPSGRRGEAPALYPSVAMAAGQYSAAERPKLPGGGTGEADIRRGGEL